jgi:hypothetical protein
MANAYKTIIILAVIALLSIAVVPAKAESDASKIARLEAELADLKSHVGPVIENLGGVYLRELKAMAGVLSTEVRGLAIDLSAKSGEYCLRDPKGGRFMVHFSEHPEATTEDVLYFIAADSLQGSGLNLDALPVMPKELGKMIPRTWYHYDGQAIEPHHKGRLGRPYLVLALDIK